MKTFSANPQKKNVQETKHRICAFTRECPAGVHYMYVMLVHAPLRQPLLS
jgi:hypothetical protein